MLMQHLTLLKEGCTIPFIARYRKERTGNLDELQITHIAEMNVRLIEIDKRKDTILRTIGEQESLPTNWKIKSQIVGIIRCWKTCICHLNPNERTKAQNST